MKNRFPVGDSGFRCVLLLNGIVDCFSALLLAFPLLRIPLPGFSSYSPELAFAAGGWGTSALAFGVARIWASGKTGFHRPMSVLGMLEGSLLSVFCVACVVVFDLAWIQAILPCAIGSVFGAAYAALLATGGGGKRGA